MDSALKELDKLDKLTSFSPAAAVKSKPIEASLDALLDTLRDYKTRLQAGTLSDAELKALPKLVEGRKKDIDARQQEIYGTLSRYGKALDKLFVNSLPTYQPLFASEEANDALEHVIAIHFLRTGRFATAQTFIEEFNVDISSELQSQFVELNRILCSLRSCDIGPALAWAKAHRDFLVSRSSPLEFYLHRSEYLRLLLSADFSAIAHATSYARTHFHQFYGTQETEIQRLMACLLYMPIERLKNSPYSELASDSIHTTLEPMFATEFSASLGMSKQVPLRVVGDIGGGGALARIEKGLSIMRSRKSEWSQTDELPIEVPLPPENRYHSVFACPVSKDQTTEQNPPMMMSCGHVISKDSLQKLGKAGGRVKCPYCPTESRMPNAVRMHF
ncbi:CTLH/CRA C-terminal to lish motif domain-containing protein [Vararia minispora EC-137]|uniref:CTLH/CRA C-terminal to lish motif domain-containing protein n=1 Tax=Vararia minispora EC-137 TaxID=1314806 RepID=A0ACB8QGJ6_9AGAM|nr:CTLH/CRA C-terminal to lish motif domain-containing protein [Vararia minispora EC-137]